MNSSITTTERRPLGGQGAMDPLLFRVVLIFGHVAAQFVVLFVWVYGSGAAAGRLEGTQFFETLHFAAFFVVPPALVIGVIDGVALANKTFAPRMTATVLLVLLAVFWIAPVGVFAMAANDLFAQTAEPTPRAVELGALVGMEVALVAELMAAVLVWTSLRLWRRCLIS